MLPAHLQLSVSVVATPCLLATTCILGASYYTLEPQARKDLAGDMSFGLSLMALVPTLKYLFHSGT